MESSMMRSAAFALLIGLGACGGSKTAAPTGTANTNWQKAPTSERIQTLLSDMTVEEKVAQITCVWQTKTQLLDDSGNFDGEKAKANFPHGIGCIARPSDLVGTGKTQGVDRGRTPASSVEIANAIQTFALENTRQGIPVLFHEEGLHGFQAADATNFPQSIALASTWNPELIEEVYTVVAREIRARGVHHVLSPVVDVARDPRWGRTEETFGEDPYLVSQMGLAAVRGFQGRSDVLAEDRVLTTLKHMTGHGQPEAGMNVGPANISERDLREIFFPPFEVAIRDGNAASVMASYNEIDGVPSHASTWLLQDVLRGEWAFGGLVVSDYFAIDELHKRHSITPDIASAGRLALETGIDLELPDPAAYPLLLEQFKSGDVDMAALDRAVARMLAFKERARIWETPYADADYAETITGNAEARALAVRAAQQAIILLKNDGDLLPLDAATPRKILVVGPNAAETRLGGYSDFPRQTVSILDGIRAAVGPGVEVDFAQGVKLTDISNWWIDEANLADPAENMLLIREAVIKARDADLIILAIGGNDSTSREAWAETHMGDRHSIDLIGEQQQLIDALVSLNKPTVAILINGRPLAITKLKDQVPAILEGWILGQETGTAVADVLFGKINPGGKLPITIPRSAGHIPAFYNHKPTARRGYAFEESGPLFPFGFGLGYTRFDIGDPVLSSATIANGAAVDVSVTVTNTGQVAGDETVQIYVRDDVSSVSRPVKELKAFKRITLAPGETQTVTLSLGPEAFRFYDINMERKIEDGTFTIMAGANSVVVKTVSLTIGKSK